MFSEHSSYQIVITSKKEWKSFFNVIPYIYFLTWCAHTISVYRFGFLSITTSKNSMCNPSMLFAVCMFFAVVYAFAILPRRQNHLVSLSLLSSSSAAAAVAKMKNNISYPLNSNRRKKTKEFSSLQIKKRDSFHYHLVPSFRRRHRHQTISKFISSAYEFDRARAHTHNHWQQKSKIISGLIS